MLPFQCGKKRILAPFAFRFIGKGVKLSISEQGCENIEWDVHLH